MREDEIVRALAFVQGAKVQDVPVEQRFKFLNERLTAEEIEEVKRRFEGKSKKGAELGNSSSGALINSEKEAGRLTTINSHFSLMTGINIASLAILTTMGVSFFLDNVKEKRDASLREELKDRLQTGLNESQTRVRVLEQSLTEIVGLAFLSLLMRVLLANICRTKNCVKVTKWKTSLQKDLSSMRTRNVSPMCRVKLFR